MKCNIARHLHIEARVVGREYVCMEGGAHAITFGCGINILAEPLRSGL